MERIQDTENTEHKRTVRLLQIVQQVRNNPNQSITTLLSLLNISKSQFYKDRSSLAEIGFLFTYRKASGFQILEDKLSPVTGLTFSDRIILMFALEYLSTTGDGLLAARAVEVGRKLAGGLESPFREQLLSCFDQCVTHDGFGVDPDVFSVIQQAIGEGRRLRILYQRSEDWTTRWREIDPKRIYLRQRTLYLYARTVDESPFQWKVFRLSRIQKVQVTSVSILWNPNEDDGFQVRQKNAFSVFLGTEKHEVSIRFTGNAAHYAREQQWHSSQQCTENDDGSLLLTVCVAEPQEVVRWARQFGDEAELVAIKGSDPEKN